MYNAEIALQYYLPFNVHLYLHQYQLELLPYDRSEVRINTVMLTEYINISQD